jgi:riboflavin biosynthesis pyrimidine reductase
MARHLLARTACSRGLAAGNRSPQDFSMMRPEISVNVALSADGKISDVGHRPADWTSPADKQRLRELRQAADALMVGRGTWQADQMKMRVRDRPDDSQPLRCVISSSGNFDPNHPMFATPGGPIHLLAKSGGNIPISDHRVTWHSGSLADFLGTLTRVFGVRKLHCEGGGQLIRELAELDAIDTLHATFCGHTLFGGATAPTASGVPAAPLLATRRFRLVGFEPFPEFGECFLRYVRETR